MRRETDLYISFSSIPTISTSSHLQLSLKYFFNDSTRDLLIISCLLCAPTPLTHTEGILVRLAHLNVNSHWPRGLKCDYRVSESSVSNSNTCKSFATNCKFFSSKASFSPPPILRVWCQRVSKRGGREGGERKGRPPEWNRGFMRARWGEIRWPWSDTWRPQPVPSLWEALWEISEKAP